MEVFYEEIVKFLQDGTYPESDGVSSAKRWNFRRRVSQYFLGENNKLYKVNLNIIYNFQ